LRQAAAVVGVFVSNQDAVEAVNVSFNRGKPRQGFAFPETSVDKEAGAPGF
jgi:hypothetical protein